MKSLPESFIEDFRRYWVLLKTLNAFSAMPFDQGHEQNNALVKGLGGAIGLTENPGAFMRWMTAGPEQARLLKEFECQFYDQSEELSWLKQHEQCSSVQELFKKQVHNLAETIANMGNPFMDDCPELLILNTRNCASEHVVDTVRNIQSIGLSQYNTFVKDVIVNRDVPIQKSIKKNYLPLLKRPSLKKTLRLSKRLLPSKVTAIYSVTCT